MAGDQGSNRVKFGFSLTPTLEPELLFQLVATAEGEGLDLVGIQDHPYVPQLMDTFALAGVLLGRTSRISVFPDVANLPLRPPAMMAKAAAALDLLSGGRFELAVGAGGYWDAITRLGVPRRTPAEANVALTEAIAIMRAFWSSGTQPIHLNGEYYTVDGVKPGPVPSHPIEIWSGAIGPKALRLTAELADGWASPIPSYLPYEKLAGANRILDEAARAAGRDPSEVRRIAQVVGTITDGPGELQIESGAAPLRGNAGQWADFLTSLATEQPFTSFIFWPEQQSVDQVTRFAREVIPRVHN